MTADKTDQSGAVTRVSVGELERLYQTRFHDYLRVAETIAGDRDSGFDAVQEAFARALQYRSDATIVASETRHTKPKKKTRSESSFS